MIKTCTCKNTDTNIFYLFLQKAKKLYYSSHGKLKKRTLYMNIKSQQKIIVLLFTIHSMLPCTTTEPTKDTKKIALHFRSYLTPSIPEELYLLIVDYINRTTDLDISFSRECKHSGPPQHLPDPFFSEEIDIGHICSPPFIWLTEQTPCSVELLSLVPQFR